MATHDDSNICTCGLRYGMDSVQTSMQDCEAGDNVAFDASPARTTLLDASFVHLPKSLLVREEDFGFPMKPPNDLKPLHGAAGYQEHYDHMKILERVATDANRGSPMCLCLDCVRRVEKALDNDSERLEWEYNQYTNWIREEKSRISIWQRAISSTASSSVAASSESVTAKFQDDVLLAKGAFLDEIDQLREAIQQSESELSRLHMIQKEQSRLAEELDLAEEEAEQERNALELEARGFNDDQEQLHRLLSRIQDESMRLMSPEIRLPAVLFNLQVDKERGLRYPLINKLRLAYRPKGDIEWSEIQAAWSLAAHLLIVIGTFFDFQSHSWKVVPLSNCAKLIYYPLENGKRSKGAVYNLGHPKTHNARALAAWNALLHDLAKWVSSKMKDACEKGLVNAELVPPLPFEVTSSNIGSIVLTQLGEDDEIGWSRAIHCMASDLLWLSECASIYTRQQVLLLAYTT